MNITSKENNPFEITSGSMRIFRNSTFLTVIFSLLLITLFIVKSEIIGLLLICGLIATLGVMYSIFTTPKNGIYLLLVLGFIVTGASRYLSAPMGLLIDVILVVIYVALFFKGFAKKVQWSNAKSSLTILVTIWMAYILLQLVNPEVISIEAWFYAMRGVGFYQVMSIPLLFLLFNKNKDLQVFLIIWGVMSLIGTFKGLIQYTLGLDAFEQAWLDKGSFKTHVLFGKLRIFSFYSDAGQFGASQAHAGLVFGILALFRKCSAKLKIFYFTVAFAGFFGMFVSGTRGTISVPALGGILFLILRKNTQVLLLGGIFMALVYVFFAHTSIGQGNAEIRRMRTAFDPNDASFQIRLANQRKLSNYLASRPFGGGLGATGNWGQRFAPNSFLANTATDSWYVMIWADTGVVGLIYYLFMIFFVLITGVYNVMVRIKNADLKVQITALTCGMAGIMIASYGNGVFGQMPTGILMYATMTFIFISPKIDDVLSRKLN